MEADDPSASESQRNRDRYEWSYTNAAVDETSPEAGGLQVWVLLCAGHLDAPHLLPGIVQLHVDRVNTGMVGRHRIAHVSGDPLLLDGNTVIMSHSQNLKPASRGETRQNMSGNVLWAHPELRPLPP